MTQENQQENTAAMFTVKMIVHAPPKFVALFGEAMKRTFEGMPLTDLPDHPNNMGISDFRQFFEMISLKEIISLDVAVDPNSTAGTTTAIFRAEVANSGILKRCGSALIFIPWYSIETHFTDGAEDQGGSMQHWDMENGESGYHHHPILHKSPVAEYELSETINVVEELHEVFTHISPELYGHIGHQVVTGVRNLLNQRMVGSRDYGSLHFVLASVLQEMRDGIKAVEQRGSGRVDRGTERVQQGTLGSH